MYIALNLPFSWSIVIASSSKEWSIFYPMLHPLFAFVGNSSERNTLRWALILVKGLQPKFKVSTIVTSVTYFLKVPSSILKNLSRHKLMMTYLMTCSSKSSCTKPLNTQTFVIIFFVIHSFWDLPNLLIDHAFVRVYHEGDVFDAIFDNYSLRTLRTRIYSNEYK